MLRNILLLIQHNHINRFQEKAKTNNAQDHHFLKINCIQSNVFSLKYI